MPTEINRHSKTKNVNIRKLLHINNNSLLQIFILLAWAFGGFIFFQTQFPYHFYYLEQNQIFLLSNAYMVSYFAKPAWMACLLGDYLTQFYYFMYAGATILIISLLVFGDVLCRSLKRVLCHGGMAGGRASWVAFALAVVAMSVVAYFSLSVTFRLSTVIALAGGTAMWWLMNMVVPCRHFGLRVCAVLVSGILAHWMFGVGFFIFTFLEAVSALAGLAGRQLSHLRAGILVVATLLPTLFTMASFSTSLYSLNTDDALLYPGVGNCVSYNDARMMERALAYDNNYYFGKYNNVIKMYEAEKDPSEEMSFFYCLSLEQTGQLASKITSLKNPNLGTFLKISEDTPLFQIKMINELYFLLGDMTYTERAALLANTFSPDCRNVRMTKRLAEANLISGDIAAAMKYLRILSKTLVYRQWAKDHTPGTMSPKVKAEIERKQHFVNTSDNIRIGDDCYVILTQLLDSNPNNIAALDYLLCSDMLSHQRDVFIRDYEKYGPSHHSIFQQVYEQAKASTIPSRREEM